MKLTPQEAEAAVARMFPNGTAYVADGAEEHESGIVERADGRTIASFRLIYEKPWDTEGLPVVNEIRIGDIGQYCGTADEIAQFSKERGLASSRNNSSSGKTANAADISGAFTMKVDLQVAKTRILQEDNGIEIWGYVGDYKVCVCFPLDDPRVRSFAVKASEEDE